MTAGMLAPTSGVVLASNEKALTQLDRVKRDPYGRGWLLVVESSSLRRDLKNLLYEKEAQAWLMAESKRLEDMAMKRYGMALAATGGEFIDDIYANLKHFKWEELVHGFLLT
jgi:hypothetical protein